MLFSNSHEAFKMNLLHSSHKKQFEIFLKIRKHANYTPSSKNKLEISKTEAD